MKTSLKSTVIQQTNIFQPQADFWQKKKKKKKFLGNFIATLVFMLEKNFKDRKLQPVSRPGL